MDFNIFLDLDRKKSQCILDQYYPGHQIFYSIDADGTYKVTITGPDLRITIYKGE